MNDDALSPEKLYKMAFDEFVYSRGVHAGMECRECLGVGTKLYGSTATWQGGVGGAAMTIGVCDHCWGSGDRKRPWPSHREFYSMKNRLHGIQKLEG